MRHPFVQRRFADPKSDATRSRGNPLVSAMRTASCLNSSLRLIISSISLKQALNSQVTEAVLNHVGGSRSGVAGIYQRHDWKPEKRGALAMWNDHLTSAIAAGQE